MKEYCKDAEHIEVDDENLLDLGNQEEDTELQVDDEEANTDQSLVEEDESRSTYHSYKSHYGKTKKQIDRENNKILRNMKAAKRKEASCYSFVRKYKDHPKICNWCKKHYRYVRNKWRWVSHERAWYKWYGGRWHYWGIVKSGFRGNGWSWYKGYWHHGGYIYKYQHKKWYRFYNHAWHYFTKQIPVRPNRPKNRICRPVYKLVRYGMPSSLTSKRIPRCKVGRSIYMYTDHEGCKWLGGRKVYQKRVRCKVGKEHQWRKFTKCTYYNSKNGGFNYKTGKVSRSYFAFKQCKLYRSNRNHYWYWYLNGKCHYVPNTYTKKRMFKSGVRVSVLSQRQINNCPKGKTVMSGAWLFRTNKNHYYLRNHKTMRIVSKRMFNSCQFNWKKLYYQTEKQLKKNHKLGNKIEF